MSKVPTVRCLHGSLCYWKAPSKRGSVLWCLQNLPFNPHSRHDYHAQMSMLDQVCEGVSSPTFQKLDQLGRTQPRTGPAFSLLYDPFSFNSLGFSFLAKTSTWLSRENWLMSQTTGKSTTYTNAQQCLCDLLVNMELELRCSPFQPRKLTRNQHWEVATHKLKSSIWNLIKYSLDLFTTPAVLSNYIRILFCMLF